MFTNENSSTLSDTSPLRRGLISADTRDGAKSLSSWNELVPHYRYFIVMCLADKLQRYSVLIVSLSGIPAPAIVSIFICIPAKPRQMSLIKVIGNMCAI